jgi:hypothetical protein
MRNSAYDPQGITDRATAGVMRQLEAATTPSAPRKVANPVRPSSDDFSNSEDYHNALTDYGMQSYRYMNFDPETGYHVLSKSYANTKNPMDPSLSTFLNDDDRNKANTDFFRIRHGLDPQYGGFTPKGTHALAVNDAQPLRPKAPNQSTFKDSRSENQAAVDYDLVKGGSAPIYGGFALNGHHTLSAESKAPLTEDERNQIRGISPEPAERVGEVNPQNSSFDYVPEGLRENVVAAASQDYDRVRQGLDPIHGGFAENGHHVSSDEARMAAGYVPHQALANANSDVEPINPRDGLQTGFEPPHNGDYGHLKLGFGDDLESAYRRSSYAQTDYDLASPNGSHSVRDEYPHGAYGGFAPNGHHVLSGESGTTPNSNRVAGLKPIGESTFQNGIRQNKANHDMIRALHGLRPQYGSFDSNGYHSLSNEARDQVARDEMEQRNSRNSAAVTSSAQPEQGVITMPQHPNNSTFNSDEERSKADTDYEGLRWRLRPINGGFAANGHHVLSIEAQGPTATHYIYPQDPNNSTFEDHDGLTATEQRSTAARQWDSIMNGENANMWFSTANSGHHILSVEHRNGTDPTSLNSSHVIPVNRLQTDS